MKTNDVKTKRVHNLIIVDESGSMEVIRKQAFVGMNETLQTVRKMQEKFPDQEQFVTLLTFDTGHTTWHYDNTPASKTKDLDWKAYRPGGGTPLYDAIGKGISKTNAQIEDGDHVLVTIITDGEENSSEEWTLKMIRTMIEKLKKQNWTFTLIGTDTGRSRHQGHVRSRASQSRTLQLLCCRGCRYTCWLILRRRELEIQPY